MCLSDAYEIKDGKQNLVCSRVCNVSADVVSLAEASVFLYHIDCFRMVIHIQPVADIFSVSIYRKFLSMQRIVDDKRNQFFRELVWSIIVRTVGNVCREMVSVNISLYQHV